MAALATAADLATRLGRTFSPTETVQAEELLAEVSAAIRNHIRQQIDRATTTIILQGTRAHRLVLPEARRRGPTGHCGQSSRDRLASLRGCAVPVRRLGVRRRRAVHVSYGDFWAYDEDSAPSEVAVTYTHGYADVPDDLRLVCLARAAREQANPGGLSSLRIGDYSASLPGAGFTVEEP